MIELSFSYELIKEYRLNENFNNYIVQLRIILSVLYRRNFKNKKRYNLVSGTKATGFTDLADAVSVLVNSLDYNNREQAISFIRDHWDKEKVIEFVWKVVQTDQDEKIRKELIILLIDKRKLKAIPRLFRFAQINALEDSLIKFVAKKFSSLYISENYEDEDLNHSLDVLKKTLEVKDSKSVDLVLEILKYEGTESILPTILKAKLPKLTSQKLIRSLLKPKNKHTRMFLLRQSRLTDQMDGKILEFLIKELTKLASVNTKIKFNPFEDQMDEIIKNLKENGLNGFPDSIYFMLQKLAGSNVEVKLKIVNFLPRILGFFEKLYSAIVPSLSSLDYQLLEYISKYNLYFSLYQQPFLNRETIIQVFLENNLSEFFQSYKYEYAIEDMDKPKLTESEIFFVQFLQKFNLNQELVVLSNPTLENILNMLEENGVTTETEINTCTSYFNNGSCDIYNVVEALDSIEYSILRNLELVNLLDKLINNSSIEYSDVCREYLNMYMPTEFQDVLEGKINFPSILGLLVVNSFKQFLLKNFLLSQANQLTINSLNVLSSKEFWVVDNLIIDSSSDYQKITRLLVNEFKSEENRSIKIEIYRTLISLIKFSNDPELKNPIQIPLSLYNESEIQEFEEEPILVSLLIFLVYNNNKEIKLVPDNLRLSRVILDDVVTFYLQHIDEPNSIKSIELLVKKDSSARLSIVNYLEELTREVSLDKLEAYRQFVDPLSNDKNPEIRNKATLIQKRFS